MPAILDDTIKVNNLPMPAVLDDTSEEKQMM